MEQGIPQLVKLLDNSNSLVRQSAADAFRELAAYRKENRAFFIASANDLQPSSTKL
jgi:HEAT repeat protein